MHSNAHNLHLKRIILDVLYSLNLWRNIFEFYFLLGTKTLKFVEDCMEFAKKCKQINYIETKEVPEK